MNKFISRICNYSPVVVLYHSVDSFVKDERKKFFNAADRKSEKSSNIEPDIFTRHINFFKKNFNIISFLELINAGHSGKKIERPLVITFDDGYKSVSEFACPILKKNGIPAVIFVCEDLAEGKMLPVSLRINFFFYNLGKRFLTSPLQDFFPSFYQAVKDREEQKAYLDFLIFFRNSREKKTVEGYFSQLFVKAGISEQKLIKEADLYLGWQDIGGLDKSLFTIGNHGKHHYKLNTLSKEDIIEEVNSPLEKIKDVSGMQRPLYALAYGAKDGINGFARQEIMKNHFCIFTAYGGLNPQTLNLNDIRRVPITNISEVGHIYRPIYGRRPILNTLCILPR